MNRTYSARPSLPRPLLMGVLVVFGFLILTGRLFQLQLMQGQFYKGLSDSNSVSEVPIPAPRGLILDRNGLPLAKNNLRSSVFYIVSDDAATDSVTIEKLGKFLGLAPDKTAEVKALAKDKETNAPILVKDDIPKSMLIKLEEQSNLFPRTIIETIPRRSYPYGLYTAHVVGYLGPISPSEYAQLKHLGYSSSDIIGKYGIEKEYDAIVRGKPGVKKLLVDVSGKIKGVKQRPALDANGEEIYDSQGRPVYEEDIVKPVSGKDIELTMDIELQSEITPLFGDRRGAVVVMDPSDGSIFALVSSPTFDANLFIGKIPEAEWQELASHEGHPLQNRAIQNAYPPGSTFKLTTAWAALDAGKVTADTTVYCNGTFKLGDNIFRCWQRGGHGAVSFIDAVAYSCDVYFYTAGYEAGIVALTEKAKTMGFGAPSGVDLPGEVAGRLPDENWKMANKGERWFGGDTVNMAIGQGYLQVTPLQLLRMATVYANGGKLVTPHLLKIFSEENPKMVGIDPYYLDLIRSGMRAAVTRAQGTAHVLSSAPFSIAAKTGTAQDPPRKDPHSWLVAFAPFDSPKVAVVVFLENIPDDQPKAVNMAVDVFALPWMKGYILGEK